MIQTALDFDLHATDLIVSNLWFARILTHHYLIFGSFWFLSLAFVLLRHNKMPGVRCPACKQKGQEVWVIPGTRCHKCGYACRTFLAFGGVTGLFALMMAFLLLYVA